MTSAINLSDLNGSNGFVANGIDAYDSSGLSVSSAGDVNGDGFDDIIIGAFRADPNGRSSGESYVVFGNNGEFPSSFELSDLNGSNGFILNGINAGDDSGSSVSSAGDVNGDGFDDIIIGAAGANPNGFRSGQSYVVFGSSEFPSRFELSALNGSNGFVVNGITTIDVSGGNVSSAGDVNGDGFDDIIIGAGGADPNGYDSGQSYVVFGSSGFPARLELSALNGSDGFVLNGINSLDSASVVSSAGDVNGDGFDDIIIGAGGADPNGDSSGQSYVVFGSSSGFPAYFELSALNGSNGFVLNGIDAGDNLGGNVSSAGDVNGDGFDDIIIGASGADPNGYFSGQSYVVFGSSSGFPAYFELSDLDGSNGFILNGINERDYLGRSVSSAGDVNGDGFDDIIIGAFDVDSNGEGSGQSYVVFGSSSGFPAYFELSALNGRNGFTLYSTNPNNFPNSSVSSAGDINGDGFGDVILGLSRANSDGNIDAGQSYVVFGFSNSSIAEDTIFGNNDSELIQGSLANDSIFGNPGNDTVRGEDGNDWINGNQDDDFLDGGNGIDTLYGGKDNDTLIGGEARDELFGNLGEDLLEGHQDDDLLYGGQANDTLSGNDGNDLVSGDNGDDLIDGNDGQDTVTGGDGNDSLDGGEGNDSLNGGDGDDFLIGAAGNDTLEGGEGSDLFVITSSDGTDLILDLLDGIDFLVLDGGLTFENLTLTPDGNHTLLQFNTEILAILDSIDVREISASDFV